MAMDLSGGFVFPANMKTCIKRIWLPFFIDKNRSAMDKDNHYWISTAEENNLVVGTKARILFMPMKKANKTGVEV
jgi:hypothetical protein